MRHSSGKVKSIVIFCFLVSGCASHAHLDIYEPLTVPQANYKIAYVSVTGEPDVSIRHGYEEVRGALENTFLDGIEKRHIFSNVFLQKNAGPKGDGVVIHVHIMELNYVSRAGRIGGGIMAGRAHLKVRIILVDTKTGESVGKMMSWATSDHMHGLLGTVSSAQVDSIVDKIVQALN